MTSTPTQLDYAPAPPRRRKWIRRGVLIFATLVIGFCAWRFGPTIWRQGKVLYWQRACANYTMLPDTIVYEEDPQAAAKLLAGVGYGRYPLIRNGGSTAAAANDPQCWQQFRPGTTLFVAGGIPSAGTGAFVFVHERTSHSGNRRIVCVHYFPETNTFTPGFIDGYNYADEVLSLATLTKAPVEAMRVFAIDVISGFPRHAPGVRMFAGQIDPNDASHFTIRYQMWGQEDVLDGRLNDDDTVTLTPRKQLQDAK